MCGIAGIYSFTGHVDAEELDRLTDSITHRGPDGRGVYIHDKIGLGHRRLAILDLSDAGKCPMPYGGPDQKRYWITFNGEVYNFIELRAELEKLGYRFRTQTDTEVVVAAYAEWGEKCLLKFNGMWALAVWDALEETLFLARDRFAIKPLYFYKAERFVFASELKAFLTLKGFHPALNEELIPSVIKKTSAYIGMTNETLMSGVRRLPGGYFLKIGREGKIRIDKWWETADHIPQIPTNDKDRIERFRELFFDAVRIRMRSDVPIGTSLSGGLDSSAVASAMAWLHHENADLERCPDDWQRTFVATFPGTMLDEREYAEEVVRHINAKAHYWVFENDDALCRIVNSVWSVEDVYDGITVPAWCTYKQMRRNRIIVSIDGQGADELLGGYTWYLNWRMNAINLNLYTDFHSTLLPAILRNYDKCSMAHGIEVRMPFMDWRLVTYAFGLPPEWKIGGGYTKRILREATKHVLPEKIWKRRSKIGMNAPMIEWFNGGLIPFIKKITSHPLWLESPYWDGPNLRKRILSKSMAKGWTRSDWGFSLQVWTLMNIVIWRMLFVEQCAEELG